MSNDYIDFYSMKTYQRVSTIIPAIVEINAIKAVGNEEELLLFGMDYIVRLNVLFGKMEKVANTMGMSNYFFLVKTELL